MWWSELNLIVGFNFESIAQNQQWMVVAVLSILARPEVRSCYLAALIGQLRSLLVEVFASQSSLRPKLREYSCNAYYPFEERIVILL